MTIRSSTLVATTAILGAAALQLTGCGNKAPLQIVPASAVDVINREVAARSGFTPTEVNCPSGIEAKVGSQFACTFSGPSGKYTIKMTVTKVDGNSINYDMSWRLTEQIGDDGGAPPTDNTDPGSDVPSAVPPGTDTPPVDPPTGNPFRPDGFTTGGQRNLTSK